MNLVSITEVVAGLVLDNRLPPGGVDTSLLLSPYGEVVEAYRAGLRSHPKLMDKFGMGAIEAALNAVASLNGADADWLEVLRQAKTYTDVADKFDRYSRRLRQGEAIDPVEALAQVQRLSTLGDEVTTLDQITRKTHHFQKTWWEPADKMWGGIPNAGVLTLGGMPKSGKSRLTMLLVALQATHRQHSLVFSLEMPADEWKDALLRVVPGLKEGSLKYVHTYQGDEWVNVARMAAIAGQTHAKTPLRLIVGDMAEMFLDTRPDEPGMTHLWRSMASLSRQLRCCYLATAQFNDQAYHGGIPMPHHIRYGRMVIAYSSAIWCIYNPNVVYSTHRDDAKLPTHRGRAWLIDWVSRFGFDGDEAVEDEAGQDSGAVLVDWSKKSGWGGKALDYVKLKELVE